MSLLSRYVARQVKKHGLKTFMIKLLEMVAKATPSKKDDKAVQDIKKILNKYFASIRRMFMKFMPETVIIIPSRMAAKRLPGKPLLKLNNNTKS